MSTAAAEFAWTRQGPKAETVSFFEFAPFAVALCESDGAISDFNPALERMLGGRSLKESLSFADLVHPDDRQGAGRLLRELLDRQRDAFHIDSKTVAPDKRIVRWTAWRAAGESRESGRALVLAQEVPQDQDAAQRLRQAERLEAVGRLAGGVAHDFNNLLTGVLLYCDLLLAHLEPCHRVRKYAEEIRKAGLQASGLVRQLLAVARPTHCEPRLLSLNEISEGMRNLLTRLIGENVALEFQLDPNLGLIKMDPTQAQQVLLNLALNARDAMPSGGRITVATCNCKVQVLTEKANGTKPAPLPCALFVVSDTGSGMDDTTRAHLFEAFFTTKASKGTGLGLATVHDIVTSNGGLIHVDSAVGCGTRVSVLLPLISESLDSSPGNNREIHALREK